MASWMEGFPSTDERFSSRVEQLESWRCVRWNLGSSGTDALVRNLQGRLGILAVSVHFEGDTHVNRDHQDFPSNHSKQSSGSVEEINEKMLKQVISAKQPSENMATGSGNAEGEVKQSKCSTCNAFVGDSKQTEWHKHNLRRKTRQLPPITAEECLADLDLNDMKSDLKEYSF